MYLLLSNSSVIIYPNSRLIMCILCVSIITDHSRIIIVAIMVVTGVLPVQSYNL